jgi:hypothetical protein
VDGQGHFFTSKTERGVIRSLPFSLKPLTVATEFA